MSKHHKFHAGIWNLLVFLFAVLVCSIPAGAQVTSLTLVSDSGDYVGGRQFYSFTLPTPVSFHNKILANAFRWRFVGHSGLRAPQPDKLAALNAVDRRTKTDNYAVYPYGIRMRFAVVPMRR